MPTTLAPTQTSLTFVQILLNLSLAFSLAYGSAAVYRKVHTGPSSSYSFFITLLLTPVVVAMIMMAIGSNMALSLGLVGALSILRFRTVIKDSRDMAYLFLVVGIGLCCGSGGYGIAIAGTLFICVVALVIHWMGRAGLAPAEYILVYRKNGAAPDGAEEEIDRYVHWRRLHGASDLGEDQGCEYTYRVRLRDGVCPEELLGRLCRIKSLSQSCLISPDTQLAL